MSLSGNFSSRDSDGPLGEDRSELESLESILCSYLTTGTGFETRDLSPTGPLSLGRGPPKDLFRSKTDRTRTERRTRCIREEGPGEIGPDTLLIDRDPGSRSSIPSTSEVGSGRLVWVAKTEDWTPTQPPTPPLTRRRELGLRR